MTVLTSTDMDLSMLIEQVEKLLEESLEDYVMSRSERKEFKQLMNECKGDSKKASMIRQLSFRLARGKVEESHQVMDWLEAVIKVVYSKENEVSNRAYFSPGNDCLNEIRSFIAGAQETLDICVFTITDDRIVEAIMEANKRGVEVKLISDDDKSSDLGADVIRLKRAGIATVMDVTDAHMHHKFAIADGKRLLSGSYNWTRSAATKNNENITVTNDGQLVKSYLNEFDRLWKLLKPLQ